MANIIKRVWNQNRMVQIEDLRGMTFQAEQAGHTFQISGIDDDGNTVVLTGTPSGVLLRPDNTDVALTCSVSGGVVSATLPANCYDVPGRFGLTIFITSGSSKTAIYAAVGTVTRTSSGTVAPGTSQSVVDLINAINAAINSIPASYSSLLADIAPDYSNSALYSVGQYAWYDGDLKRCIVPITTAESYTAAHWTSAVLGHDVSDLKSAITHQLEDNTINLSEEIWEPGYISSNGAIATDSPSLHSANFNSCSANQKYYIYQGSGYTKTTTICWYDSSKNILSRESKKNGTVTAPATAAYFKISLYDYGTTYNWDIAVFAGEIARDYIPSKTAKDIKAREDAEKANANAQAHEKEATIPAVVSDVFINGSSGNTSSSIYYKATDYVDISDAVPGTKVKCYCTLNGDAGIAFYDRVQNYISGINGNNAGSYGFDAGTKIRYINIPDNACYFRATLNNPYYTSADDFDIRYIYLPGVRETETAVVDNSFIFNDINDFSVTSDKFVKGSDGTLVDSVYYVASDYIDLSKIISTGNFSCQAVLQSGAGIAFYNYAKTYISGIDGNNAASYGFSTGVAVRKIPIPENAMYVRLSMQKTLYSTAEDFHFRYLEMGDIPLQFNSIYKRMYLGTLSNITNESMKTRNNVFYSADQFKLTVGSVASCGLQFDVRNFVAGNTITAEGERDSGNDFAIRILVKDSNNNILANVNTKGNRLSCIIPEGANYVEITYAACWGTALPSGTVVTFTNVSIKYETPKGFGDNYYTGEQIVLANQNPTVNKCKINTWKDFKGSDIPNITDYEFHLNQSMAIFGGYVFLFNWGNNVVILNYADKSIIGRFYYNSISESNHQNSAQFTNVYYNDDDEFPLLLISRCEGNGADECLVYRVTRNNNTFTFAIVNTIVFDGTTYGSDWNEDTVNNKLYMSANVNAPYTTTENNPINYYAFEMPSKAELISGNAIHLSSDDAVAHIETEHATPQGMYAIGGKVYHAVLEKLVHATIHAVGVSENRILSRIPLVNDDEPEGVAVYDSKMYVTQKRGNDTEGVNPLTIYEITF